MLHVDNDAFLVPIDNTVSGIAFRAVGAVAFKVVKLLSQTHRSVNPDDFGSKIPKEH